MLQENESILHIINGDAAASVFKQAKMPGTLLVWRDVLHEGPVPGGVRRTELHKLRANYIADHGWGTYFNTLNEFAERDNLLESQRFDEYTLWLEADLYDQLQLIQIIDTLRLLGTEPEQISLICVAEHPGIQRFIGLSQLSPYNMVQLFQKRERIKAETIEAASKAWRIFSGPDPTQLLTIGDSDIGTLPYIGEAFHRLAQEYPSTANGLSLTQKRILETISREPTSQERLFHSVSDQETRPYLGDIVFYDYVDGLLNAPYPLLTLEERQDKNPRLIVTATGLDVMAGTNDHVALNGIDKWIGGIHLQRGSPGWRYNEPLGTLMSSVL
jgi:hypothetical protein